jgi:alkylation response protein AidB-like acyl-CoA dehydrogenase
MAVGEGASFALPDDLPDELREWLRANADSMDTTADLASEIVPRLAGAGLFATGVPETLGGNGGTTADAIEAIAAVAQYSVTAAFVFWGQRTFIEYLLQSPNDALRERWLGPLMRGSLAGATGLSNAMKFLSGIESLQITASAHEGGWQLDGALAWITNLRHEGFIAAAAVDSANGAPPAVVAFTSDSAGVARSADLDLMALRSSNTAAVKLAAVQIGDADVIHANAREYLPGVRPSFLGMQCGLSIGLARASLQAAHALATSARGPLLQRIEALQAELVQQVDALKAGVEDGRFKTAAAPLFRLRIALAEVVQQAVLLELQASGGKAYLQDRDRSFARRWRESAFIPIMTPSLTQLQVELQKHAAA